MNFLKTNSLLTVASLVACSIASALATIEIDVLEQNTTATQAEVSFSFGGDFAGLTTSGFRNFVTIDLSGSSLDGILASANYALGSGNSDVIGANALNGTDAFLNLLESRNQNGGGSGFSRLAFIFDTELTSASTFSGTANAILDTNGLVQDADFDGLDIDWGFSFNGSVQPGTSAGVTSVAPVPEASSFVTVTGVIALLFLATCRRG